MNDEMKRLAALASAEALAAIPNQDLTTQLDLLEEDTWPISTRLTPGDNHALTSWAFRLAGSSPLCGDQADRSTFTLAFLYGFQIGHDYALKHGRLDSRDPPNRRP